MTFIQIVVFFSGLAPKLPFRWAQATWSHLGMAIRSRALHERKLAGVKIGSKGVAGEYGNLQAQKKGQKMTTQKEEREIQENDLGTLKNTIEERVEQLNDMYERLVGKHQLLIGLDVLATEFNGNIEAARSKNPKKQKSFRAIADHENLHPDIKGPVLRRWVNAAVTMQELASKGVNTDLLTYSHFREISKIKDAAARKRIADQVIAESLAFKSTEALVKAEIDKAKAGDSDEDRDLSPMAQKVMEGLEEPASMSKDDALCSFLLDRNSVRLELDFDEQSGIYSKAKKKREEAVNQQDKTEKTLESVQQSINFLDQVLSTFRSKDSAKESQE
jgi:hypothetical protein